MRIYCGNLEWSLRGSDLREIFEPFGTVTEAEVMIDRNTNRSRGFGFVEMPHRKEALHAIDTVNGQMIGGEGVRSRAIKVSEAAPRPERPSRAQKRAGGVAVAEK